MNNKLITIFTPAYNRAYCLDNLYRSLVNQDSRNFVWHIVDDGSVDNTREIVNNWIEENKISIIYDYQKNAGKHVAHNTAVIKCKTELFFCVDSDDELTEDAVCIIEKEWETLKDIKDIPISGMVLYRSYRDGILVGTEFPDGVEYSTLGGLYHGGFKGDTALIFVTDVLKKFPFPHFEGERFLRENIVYDKIDLEYELKPVRKAIYLCEYLEDGLSKNATKLELKSPKGAALYRLGEYKKARNKKTKFRNCAAFVLYSILARDARAAIKEIGLFRFVVMFPIAAGGYISYRIKGVCR